MRESNVAGLTPSSSAAPSEPLIFQFGFLENEQKVFALAALQLGFGEKLGLRGIASRRRWSSR